MPLRARTAPDPQKDLSFYRYSRSWCTLFARSVLEIDAYVLNVLLRDLVGHDKQPSAFIVYVFLYGCAERARWRPVAAGNFETRNSKKV